MSIAPSLHRLENAGLIRQAQIEPELEYIFRHALVQDASYDSLLKADRRTLHETVGKTLENLYPNKLSEFAATLADHFEKAENYQKALEYYLLAGKSAARMYANVEAEELLARAVTLILRPELKTETKTINDTYSQYGRTLELLGKYEPAIENYRQMQAEAIRRRDKRMEMDALIAQAIIQATPSTIINLSQAQSLCEQALIIAEAIGDRESECRVYWILLLIYYFKQDNQNSILYGEKSLAIARELNLRERLAFTLNDIARTYYGTGNFEKAEKAIVESRALWEELGNLPMLSDNLTSHAESKLLGGQFARAEELAQRSYRIGKQINNGWGIGYSLSILAHLRWLKGDANAALEILDELNDIIREQRLPFLVGVQSQVRSEIFFELGLGKELLELSDSMIFMKDFAGSTFNSLFEIYRALAHFLKGDFIKAAEIIATMPQAEDGTSYNTFAPLYRGQVMYMLGMAGKRYAEIIVEIRQGLSFIKKSHLDAFVPLLQYWLGNALFHNGQADEALDELNAALGLSQQAGTVHSTWRIHAALEQVHAQKADTNAQAFHRQKAREIVKSIADKMPEAYKNIYLAKSDVKAVLE